jgi:hypothetical protein
MRFTIKSEEAHLEVVARRAQGELLVVGIAPYGVRLFAVHQRGREIRVEGASSREFEHLALWTLDALHRSVWIRAPADAGSDPVVSWMRENERVTESVVAGVRQREFSRAHTSATVQVHYAAPAAATPRIEVLNPWCGYDVVIAVVDSAGPSSGE